MMIILTEPMSQALSHQAVPRRTDFTGVSLREPGLYLLKYLITKEAVILPQ